MHWECKYCDGVRAVHPYGDKEEPLICASCGAEWEDAKILVKDEEFIEDMDSDFNNEVPCSKCGCSEDKDLLEDGMCSDCYEDYLEDCKEGEED